MNFGNIWKGSQSREQLEGIISTIDLNKRDLEIKVIIGCSEAELKTIMDFHNSGAMRAILIRRQ